jgi:ABC-type uncharacterized transport system substrate-binding protein
MAALVDPRTASAHVQTLVEGARKHDVELSIYRAATAEEIVTAIDAAKGSGAEAFNVLSSAYFWGNRQIIMRRIAKQRLPAIYHLPEIAEDGGLVAYGPCTVQMFREILGPQLIKLLCGAKPSDVPIVQPSTFELIVNLKTAKTLELSIPATFLAHADEVIE